MHILITICARGGSKGIPGKNIRQLGDKPLIAYTIATARHFAEVAAARGITTDIALSTDSDAIIEAAAACGLQSDYRRPAELANDTAGKVDAIADILRHVETTRGTRPDYVLDLDVTSPLRTVADITEALGMIEADPEALNIFSVSEPGRNPYFNMVEQQPDGYYLQVKPLPYTVMSRQTAPKVYDINGSFYIYRHRFFDEGQRGAVTPRTMVYVMRHICFDLDRPLDFDFMEYLITNNRLDFTLD